MGESVELIEGWNAREEIYITHPITEQPMDKSQCKRIITQMYADLYDDVSLKIENADLEVATKNTIAATVSMGLLGCALAFNPNKCGILGAVFAGALDAAKHIEEQKNGIDQ